MWKVSLFLVSFFVLTDEFLDPASGIDDLLFTGVVGMTGRADVHVHIRFRGTGFKGSAARTFDGHFFILGVDSLFHVYISLSHFHIFSTKSMGAIILSNILFPSFPFATHNQNPTVHSVSFVQEIPIDIQTLFQFTNRL
jgi:hypothetical protein